MTTKVCSGGDTFRVYVSENTPGRPGTPKSLYSGFSIPFGDDATTSSLYFIDTDAGMRLPGNQSYAIHLVLQETQRRSLQPGFRRRHS